MEIPMKHKGLIIQWLSMNPQCAVNTLMFVLNILRTSDAKALFLHD